MERGRPTEQLSEKKGVSLRELVVLAKEERSRHPGPRISERVDWLSTAIETEVFWLDLNRHLAEDEQKRQSAGGIFTREAGQKYVGPYAWDQVFSSLDNFLKYFDMRATEFLFRDFQPENDSRNLARFVSATRELAFDKYPRLRIIYWEDYEEILESGSFWKAFSAELEGLDQPVAPNAFFGWPQKTKKDGEQQKDITATLGSVFKRQFELARGLLGKRARLLEYHNFAQIVRDHFNQDLRTYLLNYEPKSEVIHEIVEHAKELIEFKILPTKDIPQSLSKMDRSEFKELVNSEEFWLSLIAGIENHADSQTQAYSLSNFLRHYDSQENDINYSKPGTYTRLTTVYLQSQSTKRWRRRLIKPSHKLVQYLMWEFEPDENLEPLVTRVKELCAEMFPRDCLYVDLQTPQFWEAFSKDLREVAGTHSLYSFLRYFSRENPSCDGRKHKKGTSKYQLLLHRAYHEQDKFLELASQVGIYAPKYREALIEFFWNFASDEAKHLMSQKLSKDFSAELRGERLRHAELLNEAKSYLKDVLASDEKKGSIQFSSKKKAKDFRNKLWSASRTLKTNIRTRLKGTTLYVEIGKRFIFLKKDRPQFEARVKELRQADKTNEEIARELGVQEHIVEHAARTLAKRGEISLRK